MNMKFKNTTIHGGVLNNIIQGNNNNVIQGNNVGSHATISQSYSCEKNNDMHTADLINEITKVKKYIKENTNNNDDDDILVGELTQMSKAIGNKDNTKIVYILKNFGKQIYDIAKKVGCTILAKYIANNIGL